MKPKNSRAGTGDYKSAKQKYVKPRIINLDDRIEVIGACAATADGNDP